MRVGAVARLTGGHGRVGRSRFGAPKKHKKKRTHMRGIVHIVDRTKVALKRYADAPDGGATHDDEKKTHPHTPTQACGELRPPCPVYDDTARTTQESESTCIIKLIGNGNLYAGTR